MNSPCGILNVDKPAGITSRRAVDRVAKWVRPAKAGHAGTLDPLATGVLVVCVGPATRLVPIIQEGAKAYRARFRLGCRSNTDDTEGEIVEMPPERPIAAEDIQRLLPRFTGTIEQVPPQFSAVHVEGKRAYQLARRGREVELQPRTVTIHRLTLLDFNYPETELAIECGSGTYIRSIGRDLGELLGCGAILTNLVRTRVGPYDLASAVPFDQLDSAALADRLLPLASAVAHFPQRMLDEAELELVRHGRPVPIGDVTAAGKQTSGDAAGGDDETIRAALIAPDGTLAAIARLDAQEGLLHPANVFVR